MKRTTRGNTTARGYGHEHQQERARWKPIVDAGRASCARCGKPIVPGTPWDLGHNDGDRTRYNGPEHASHNRSAGARKGNRLRGIRRAIQRGELAVTRVRW